MNINLNDLANVVILAGSVCLALTNIAKLFSPYREYKDKVEGEKFKKLLEEVLPIYIDSYTFEQRERLKDLSLQMDTINKKIDLLENSSKDMLRQKILAIYHKGLPTHSLSLIDKEMLEELWKDYKAEGGNGFMEKYRQRMDDWEVTDDLTGITDSSKI